MTALEKPSSSIAGIRRALDEGRATVSDLVEESLDAIDHRDGRLNSFVRVDHEAARAQVLVVEKRLADGADLPLAGVTIGVKDNIDLAGLETRAGSRVLDGRIPGEDATVVRRLREAGAVIVGSTNMHEFALGGTSENPHFGDVGNPVDVAASPGGSSGGSAAAVAAGLVTAALGTDTCGSVRMPAAFTGTFGLRPTYGTVPLHGVVPLAPTMDTVGPITRSVADNAALFEVMSRRRVGQARDALPTCVLVPAISDVAEEVARVFRSAVSAVSGHVAVTALEDTGWIDKSVDVASTTFMREAAELHETWLHERADKYGADLLAALRSGTQITSEEYLDAARHRFELTIRARRAISDGTILMLPVFGFEWLPSHTDEVETAPGLLVKRDAALLRFISAAAVTGLPALSLPAGVDATGHPIGVQLIGSSGAEPQLYALARLLEGVPG